MKNYDLNVWDKRGYFTEYLEEGWAIGVYEIPSEGASYGSGVFRDDLSFDLTLEESKELTLGWGAELGGYYTSDSDFWIDRDGFFADYKTIPERVATLLRNLPN